MKDDDIKEDIKPYNEKGYAKNLIIVKENSVEIYTLEGEEFHHYHTFEIYAKIWNCMKIPICTIEGREQDLLFIVTDRWEWVLLLFGMNNVISTSNISIAEKDYTKINTDFPPCFYFSGESHKIIGVSLFKDIIHIIPIKYHNAEFALSEPVVMIIGESLVGDIIWLNSYKTRDKLRLVTIEHWFLPINNEYQINVYELDDNNTIKKMNKETPFNRNITKKFTWISTFRSDKFIYKLASLPFGGFLAWSDTKIMYFDHKDCSTSISSQGFLRGESSIIDIALMDNNDYKDIDFKLRLEDESQILFRFVVLTANGTLYLVLFDMKLNSLKDFHQMKISVQGNLEGIKCLTYLSSGKFICGTSAGYAVIQLQEEDTGNEDSRLIKVLGRKEEWGPVTNLEIVDRNEYDPKELIATSQTWPGLTYISVYRRGINLEVFLTEEVPRIQYSNSFMLSGTKYLVLNIARRLNIFKIIDKGTNEEYGEIPEDNAQELNLMLTEILNEDSDLIYNCILKGNDLNQVNNFNLSI